MTVGELLTAIPWIAPVEVDIPCGIDKDGETEYEIAWTGVLLPDRQEIHAEIANKEIFEATVLTTEIPVFGERPALIIFTK